jgi:hypothetical protein
MEDEVSEQSAEEIEVLGEEEQRDMLFCVQNLGVVQIVGATETYVKSKECVDLLRELYKMVRQDSSDNTIRRLQLSQWGVLANDLLKLLVNYPEDRQLAFHTVLLLATLTEKAEASHISLQEYKQSLLQYKRDFIASKPSVKVLVQHMADCLNKDSESKNEQHDQLLELIVYLLRNLLAIESEATLHSQLLHRLADETAFDAIVYMCQDFTNPVLKKLDFCFLEIFCNIFNNFSPRHLLVPQASSVISQIRNTERQKLQSLKSSRHNKFGSNFKFQRQLDQSSIISTKLDPPRGAPLSTQVASVKPRVKPNLVVEQKNEGSLVILDEALASKLRKCADDVLRHCFGVIVNSVVIEIQRDSDRMQEDDKTYFFRLQAFMFEYLREGGANNDFACLAEALEARNFEVLYRTFYSEMKKLSTSDYNAKEFQAAMAFCVQYLLLVRQMSASQDEVTQRNAAIIMETVFYHELVRVCRFAFEYWKEGASHHKFLGEIVEFNYIVLRSLEDFSLGRSLKVRTDRLRQRKAGDESDDYFSDADVVEETVYRERALTFDSEFLQLLDHEIVRKHVLLMKDFSDLNENAQGGIVYYLLKVTEGSLADVTSLLYQVENLEVIEEVLKDPKTPVFLQEILDKILADFFAILKENPLIAVEALFRPSKQRRRDTGVV